MGKNAQFGGQPIFSQLLNLINKSIVNRESKKHNGNKYYKKYKSYNHLVTMLYAIFHKCSSLREIETGMQVCSSKLNHLGLSYSPRRSTISDANARRSSLIFEGIYKELYRNYGQSLSDSRNSRKWISKLFIVDSTTISLFKEILKNAGRTPMNGKRKGGIKVHALIKADEDVPRLVQLTAAAKHDTPFIQNLKLPEGSIITFDKAYVDYSQYDLWNKEKVTWVTRLKKGTVYEELKNNIISQNQKELGVRSDQNIILGHTTNDKVTRTPARLIQFYDKEKNKEFLFITNAQKYAPATVANIYKHRWQIELLFKRLKQNYPLQYFLGDNENAIKIQIWCALIADLLLKVVLSKLKKKWSFSNLASMIRIHLMTYVRLYNFLNHPDKMILNVENHYNKGSTLFNS